MANAPRIEDAATRTHALELLRSGGVVVLPTDTLYGFHASLSDGEAVERIRLLKGGGERRFVLLASSVDMVERYVASFGCVSREEMERRWPARVTVILPSGETCPEWMEETVAFRVPALEPLRELIEVLGEPIVSTSVNRSGEEPMDDPAEMGREFDVELVVSGKKGGPDTASAIVDLCGENPRLLRGSYDWAATKPSK